LKATGQSKYDEFDKRVIHGSEESRAEFPGEAMFNIASMFIGVGELSMLAKRAQGEKLVAQSAASAEATAEAAITRTEAAATRAVEKAVGEGTGNSDGTVNAVASTTSGVHRGGLTQAQMEANARYIHDYFTKLGWSKEAISGMLGNMQWESGSINPGAWQFWNETGFGCGYGLVQWTPNKFVPKKFLQWAGLDAEGANKLAQNDPKQLMNKQLEFLLINLNLKSDASGEYGGEWIPTTNYSSPYKMKVSEFIKSDKNAGELALVFHGSFERSADAPGSTALKKRVEYANKWYNFFSE
jgi:hypothetical protein